MYQFEKGRAVACMCLKGHVCVSACSFVFICKKEEEDVKKERGDNEEPMHR